MNREKLITSLQGHLEIAERQLAKFAERFSQNPAEALSWGAGTFEAAALQLTCKNLLSLAEEIEGEEFVEQVKLDLMRSVLRQARSANNYSTSATDNLLQDALAKVCADLLEKFD